MNFSSFPFPFFFPFGKQNFWVGVVNIFFGGLSKKDHGKPLCHVLLSVLTKVAWQA
jgi:hypothetical protein